MRLLWLPDVLRSAGLTVHEVDGWRSRGSASWDPRGIICHETRGSTRSTDAGEIHVLLHGSATAPPPIAQLYLSRTGHWHVIASGRCNHVRVGWAGPFKGIGNSGLLGIEAQHALGEPWTDRQYDSYVRGVAALRRRTGWGIGGHKEHQPGGYGHSSVKTDPGFDMAAFRAAVDTMIRRGAGVSAEDVTKGLATVVPWRSDGVARLAKAKGMSTKDSRVLLEMTWEAGVQARDLLLEVKANQMTMLGRDWVNEQQIVDGVLAGLGGADLDDAAAALRAAFGDRIDALVAKLAEPS